MTPLRADLQRLLSALVKLALVEEGAAQVDWHEEAQAARAQLAAAPAAERDALPLAMAWGVAVKAAESDPVVRRDETVNPMLPTLCPLSLAQVTTGDLDAAAQAIRDVASFG